MLSTITTKLSVTNLAASASVPIAHGINIEGITGVGHMPNIVLPDRATPIGVSGMTTTTVTFTNFGDVTASADFYVALDHTIQKDHADLGSTLIWLGNDLMANAVISPADLITLAGLITDPIKFNDKVKVIGAGLTAYDGSEVALTGWGGSATAAATGNDQRMRITVTTAAADIATSQPTVEITFKDGNWTTAPYAVVCAGGTSSTLVNTQWAVSAVTATTLTVRFEGTPTLTSAFTYTCDVIVVG